MSGIRKIEVLTVSVSSFCFSVFGALILLIIVVLTRVRNVELVSLLIGRDASQTLLSTSQADILTTVDSVLGHNALGPSTVFGLWMFVGLLVFVLITAIQKGVMDVKEIRGELMSPNVNRPLLIHGLARDMIFRVGVAIAWALYTWVWFQMVFPFLVASVYVIFGPLVKKEDFIIALLAVFFTMISLHIHVVFARLLVGRTRLFNT